MMLRKEMVGLAVYHGTDLREQPELITELLAAAAASRDALFYMQGQFASSDRFSKQQKVTDDRIEQLLTDIRGDVFRTIQFDEIPRSQQEASPGYASLQMQIHPAANPRVSSPERPAYPFRLHMLLPREGVREAKQLEDGLASFARVLGSEYGFAHVATDFRDALMEVTSTPMFPWGRPLTPVDLRRQERLKRCQVERVQIGRLTCGAYWGNLLGEEFIAQLGGVERVRREAPADIIRMVAGSVYLQVTTDLPRLDDPEYRLALDNLDAYLLPVSVMQAKQASGDQPLK